MLVLINDESRLKLTQIELPQHHPVVTLGIDVNKSRESTLCFANNCGRDKPSREIGFIKGSNLPFKCLTDG